MGYPPPLMLAAVAGMQYRSDEGLNTTAYSIDPTKKRFFVGSILQAQLYITAGLT